MPAALLPPDELARLTALHRLNVLDTPPDPAFDDLTRLAAAVCGTPIALVSLLDADRQWFKSRYGLDATDTPRAWAFCHHAIRQPDLFEVADARGDGRFATSPLVTGPPHVRFYAGVPLVTPDGHAVGTLCVMDHAPRTLTPDQRDALQVLARQVVAHLRLRERPEDQARDLETFRVLFEQSSDAHLLFDERDGIIDCNHAAVQMLRVQSKAEVLRLHPAALSPDFQPDGRRSLEKCVEMDATARRNGHHRFDWTHRRADGETFPCEVTLTPVRLHGRSVLLVVWHDLTDRKRREDAVRADAERRRQQQIALLELLRDDLRAGEAATRRVLAVVAGTLRVERVSVWHLTPERDAIRCGGLYEWATDRHSAGQVLSAADYPGYFAALASDEVIAAADAATDPRTREFRDGYLTPLGITSMLDVPLRLGGRVVGVLCHEHIGPPREWAADEQVFALAAANILSLAAEQAERRRAEDARRASEGRFRGAFDYAPIGMALVAPDGRWLKVNRALSDILGYHEDELLATDFQTLTHPDDLGTDLDLVGQILAGDIPSYQIEKRYFHKGGGVVHALLAVSLVRDAAGRPLYFISHVRDVTARKRAEDALRESEAKFRNLVDGLADGVLLVDAHTRRVLDANPAALRLFGYTAAEVTALTLYDLCAHERASSDANCERVLREGRVSVGRREYRHKGGHLLYLDLSASVIRLGGRQVLTVVFRDVSGQMAAEERVRQYQVQLERANAQLQALATTDGLTGVKNRAAFDDALAEEFDRAVRYAHPLSLVLLDVDHFKSFNDTFGHPAGDGVLRRVAGLLQNTVRGADVVARYGGEEFAVILPDTDAVGAEVLAERCRRAVAGASWDRRAVTVSVGVSTLTPDTANAVALVKEADDALYRSKQTGRNRVSHNSATITPPPARTLPVG